MSKYVNQWSWFREETERERETETEIQKKCKNKYNIQYYSVRGPFLSQQHRQMIGQQTEDSTDQIDCN